MTGQAQTPDPGLREPRADFQSLLWDIAIEGDPAARKSIESAMDEYDALAQRLAAAEAALPENPWVWFTSIGAWKCYSCRCEAYTHVEPSEGHSRHCAWLAARAATSEG